MNRETFHFELITPCFCGGAEPEKRAEIRAPSIRGQLRWWFRTLGGFKCLKAKGMSLREQEAYIFGSTAGEHGRAGKLLLRVTAVNAKSAVRDGQELGHRNFSDAAYLTFPIQSREKQGQKTSYAGRGVLLEGSFDLVVHWLGEPDLWADINALVTVWAHLGSLGFRGRRAMGAIALVGSASKLNEALKYFAKPENIIVKQLDPANLQDSRNCIESLGAWLKSWREHGRTPNLAVQQPGFDWARRDHNEGHFVLTGQRVTSNPPGHPPKGKDGETFRPALGLPIVQYFSSAPKSKDNRVMWDWDWDPKKNKGKGRFASPVLLRPYRDVNGKWHALVIFVDSHTWPGDHPVYLNGKQRKVSLDLYNAMKTDKRLKEFL